MSHNHEPRSDSSSTDKPNTNALNVACLGPLGTYSHQATTNFFGQDATIHTCNEIADVFKAVERGTTRYGVVPIDNSSFGLVQETSIQLKQTRLSVRAMTKLTIGHALMSKLKRTSRRTNTHVKNTSIHHEPNVERIYSHEQAIGQCQSYLNTYYPQAQIISVTSTAKAALEAQQDDKALAICSLKCSDVYNLHVVDMDIQDAGSANTTRFIVLSKHDDSLDDNYPVG
ncbi:prephenate dehydratase [Microbotryomycetes sp. JL221]|nr:prephenate dehydratase [Microbotryomycetes sp. JL221]